MPHRHKAIAAALALAIAAPAAGAPLIDEPLALEEVTETAEHYPKAENPYAEAIAKLAPAWSRDATMTLVVWDLLEEVTQGLTRPSWKLSKQQALGLVLGLAGAAADSSRLEAPLRQALLDDFVAPALAERGLRGDESVVLGERRVRVSALDETLASQLRAHRGAALAVSQRVEVSVRSAALPEGRAVTAGRADTPAAIAGGVADLEVHLRDFDANTGDVTVTIIGAAASYLNAPALAFGLPTSFALDGVFAEPVYISIGETFFPSPQYKDGQDADVYAY
jgi:hypothetical protein